MRKALLIGGIILLGVIVAAVILFYPTFQFMTHIEVVQLDSSLTLMLGGGGNSGIIVGDSCVVVVDTKMMGDSEDLFKLALEKANKKPIIVVNTHYHPDHVRGNKYFKGSKIYIGGYDKDFLKNNIAAENMPTDMVKDSLLIDLGSEKVHVYNLGQSHTTNDMVVYLSNHSLLFTGDLVFNRANPVLMAESGAKVSSWIRVLDVILGRWGESRIVPGHGGVGDKTMVASERQYFVDMTTAANDPSKESQLKETYKDWMSIPFATSPGRTIEYIKLSEMKK
jgi:glyoxylase-like metal-dependent hydrolase (beta-lactamase superfamily II)